MSATKHTQADLSLTPIAGHLGAVTKPYGTSRGNAYVQSEVLTAKFARMGRGADAEALALEFAAVVL